MKGFRDRLRNAVTASQSYSKNISQLSRDAGLGEKTIYNILNDAKLDHSQTGPGLFGMARVARLLETSLDHLAGSAPPFISTQNKILEHTAITTATQTCAMDRSLSSDSLIRLHLKSGARIEAFTPYLHRCDIYEVPAVGDRCISVQSVGKNSLSALTMGTASTKLLQAALDTVEDKALRERWVLDYFTAAKRGDLTTLETLDVQMPNHPVRVKMDFIRVLLSVSDAVGQKSVLNFSLLIA